MYIIEFGYLEGKLYRSLSNILVCNIVLILHMNMLMCINKRTDYI